MDGSNNTHPYPPKTVIAPGMPVAVILLRDQGRRITRQQMDAAAPLFGRLKIESLLDEKTIRARMRATLGRPLIGDLGSVYKPLFNPVIEHADHTGFVLSGYEIDVVEGVSVQYVQAWLVRPIP